MARISYENNWVLKFKPLKIIMNNVLRNNPWLRTNNLYNNWVANNKLRKFFSKNICYDGLSLWWISRVVSKDNVIENEWYFRLNEYLNKKKNI